MKTVLLLAALLLALSSRLFALSATHSHDPWAMYPRVLATKRVIVTVVAMPSSTQKAIRCAWSQSACRGRPLIVLWMGDNRHWRAQLRKGHWRVE